MIDGGGVLCHVGIVLDLVVTAAQGVKFICCSAGFRRMHRCLPGSPRVGRVPAESSMQTSMRPLRPPIC